MQWDSYRDFHAGRKNLVIHIVAVPTFLLGNLLVIAAIPLLLWWAALIGLLVTLVGIAVQGRGHKTEANPSIPFDGAKDALGRIFTEQWVTFPRFVLTGGWRRALRDA